ncbi:MAG: TetR/AcrR family transcriptional regulator [Tropicimonas sp.]|uniref:TetR/AcrR family transcriptional regulator n=1 Tax=Tropicimonas sp. TaxID=2067044 RepID=UPI003A86827B
MTREPRPTRIDGEATRKRILEAAGRLFAETGFAETTNKAIAAQAGADLASINYHFGSRAGLYRAVLIEAHRRIISLDDLERLLAANLTASGKLKRLIARFVMGATAKRGWYAKVLSREILSPSSHLSALSMPEIVAKMEIALAILSEITAIPRDDPALMRCLMSVLAPCAMLLVGQQNISPLPGAVLQMPRRVLIDHLHRFAMGGLEAMRR